MARLLDWPSPQSEYMLDLQRFHVDTYVSRKKAFTSPLVCACLRQYTWLAAAWVFFVMFAVVIIPDVFSIAPFFVAPHNHRLDVGSTGRLHPASEVFAVALSVAKAVLSVSWYLCKAAWRAAAKHYVYKIVQRIKKLAGLPSSLKPFLPSHWELLEV